MDDAATDLSYLERAFMLCRERFSSLSSRSRWLGLGALLTLSVPSACSKGECADPLNPQPDLPLCEVSGQSGHGGGMSTSGGSLNLGANASGGTPGAGGSGFPSAGQSSAGAATMGGSNAGVGGGSANAGAGGSAGSAADGGASSGEAGAGGAATVDGGAGQGGAPTTDGGASDGGAAGAGGDSAP
jgi:hypothetical protein